MTIIQHASIGNDSSQSFECLDFDEILGADASPLDRPLNITLFDNASARRQKRRSLSLRELASELARPEASAKAGLPLLKLATFGDATTEKGCVRFNDNMTGLDGVEIDYDAGKIAVVEATARLRTARLAGVIYTSPSHTAERPRWRIICPLSATGEPAERERLVARLNGALGGVVAGESYVQSQAFYYGSIRDGAPVEVVVVDGRALELAAELDAGALGKDGKPYRPPEPIAAPAANDDAADWDRIDSALATVLATDADAAETGGRDMYLRIGQALHHASGGAEDGRVRWEAWAKAGAKFNARDFARDWKSFGRRSSARPVTIASLFSLAASAYGWNDIGPTIGPDSWDVLSDPEPKAGRLRFLTPDDCASAPRRGYIVKGFLAPGDLACIFGAPGAGKSLIAPHLGYQLALGRSAFGMRTKPGGVFYVAAEDPHGMRGRIQALRIRYGDAPGFKLVEGVSDLFAPAADDMEALRDAVALEKPALIAIDTLAMAFPGLEENAAESMNRVVALGRKLTAHGAAVVLVHHDTKAQGPTPRGHSALNGALDVALQLFPRDETGVVRGRLTKNRNGSCERDIAFRISTESLGEDEDGDAITAAIVDELAPGTAPKAERLSRGEEAALRIYDGLEAGGAVTEEAWRAACIDGRTVSAADDKKSRQTATRRAIEGLARKGRVLISGGLAHRPGSIGRAFDGE